MEFDNWIYMNKPGGDTARAINVNHMEAIDFVERQIRMVSGFVITLDAASFQSFLKAMVERGVKDMEVFLAGVRG